MGWVWIMFGVILEVFWVSGLKMADSVLLYVIVGFVAICSIYCVIIACKSIEVSVSYAVFAGLGSGGVVLVEMFVFGGEFSFVKLFLIAILLFGVIGLKFVSKEKDDKSPIARIKIDESK